jgi:hypothetical protein
MGSNLSVKAKETEPEPRERTTTVPKLTEEPGIIEGGFKVPDDIDSKKHRAATIRQRILRKFACCEETLTEKKKSLSNRNSAPPFFKSPSGTHASPSVLVDT